MRTRIFLLAVLAGLVAACSKKEAETVDSPVSQPITYASEEQEDVTNDFTLLKACIGKTETETGVLLEEQGFTKGSNGRYQKTENGILKEVTIHNTGNAEMTLRSGDFDIQKLVFAQWMNEIAQSKAFANMVSATYNLKHEETSAKQTFDTYSDMLETLEEVVTPNYCTMVNFYGNDVFDNEYALILYPYLSAVYLQIINHRLTKHSDDLSSF